MISEYVFLAINNHTVIGAVSSVIVISQAESVFETQGL